METSRTPLNPTPVDPQHRWEGRSVNRRSLAAGVAWAAPVVSMAAAAPLTAASAPPGLQGWVLVSRSCSDGRWSFTMNNDPAYQQNNYPSAGLWVFNTTPTTTVTDACLSWTYTFPTRINFTSNASCNGWGAVTLNSSGPFPVYTMCYTGNWTYVPATASHPAYTIASCPPRLTGTSRTPCVAVPMTVTMTRTVTVDGNPITFSRSVTLG